MSSKLGEISKYNDEYQLLPYQFHLLTFLGIWCPKTWSAKVKEFHNVYFTTLFFLDFIICSEMFIYFVLSIGTTNFKLLDLFFLSANVTAVYKSIKMRRNREIVRTFIETYFNCRWMDLRNPEERIIHEKINSRIRMVTDKILESIPQYCRFVTIVYSASMIGIVLLKAASPIMESSSVPLPVDAWYPYPIEKPKWFWITYLHQVILGSSAICSHIGIDTLFVGLLLKALCQIHILKYRLHNITNICKDHFKSVEHLQRAERNTLIKCIRQHQRIYRFGKDLDEKFQDILIILVVSSLPNICINIYSLSAYNSEFNVQYIATFFSTTSALLQFFITCWYGNEVSLNSVDVGDSVCKMDWTMLDEPTQKLLVIIIARSIKPMQFTVGYIMPINLESFITIIKGSYTAFNLLQQTAK